MSIESFAQKVFGIHSLKPAQITVINKILEKEDVLALMPTGSGKSITFQLPVIYCGGRALVITPLIALMEDQVMQLNMNRIRAVAIHSGLSSEAIHLIMGDIERYQFIYCSPEWLQSEFCDVILSKVRITHIILDEAHCISQWGYQFRPYYLLVNRIINKCNVVVIGLTATASQKIINDIIEVTERDLNVLNFLHMDKDIFLYKFEIEEQDKITFLRKTLNDTGPTIIYFSSKRICDEIYSILSKEYTVDRYHADMEYKDRADVQSRYMADDVQIICATSAFGMGINKKNIRTVIHYHMPSSIYQFIQEIGRAGRDGEVCQSILLYNDHDIVQARRMIELDRIDEAVLYNYYHNNLQDETLIERINIFRKRFNDEELPMRLKKQFEEQQHNLNKMLRYVNCNNCLHNELENLSINSLDNTKSGNRLNEDCDYCQSNEIQRFKSAIYYNELETVTAILNRLFN